jgi:hypothetical protein
MLRRYIFELLIVLFLLSAPIAAEAALNPIPSASEPSTASTPVGSPPASYLQAVKTLQENKFGENEIKSFVYQVFSLFDRHVGVSNLELLFSEDNMYMSVPEGKIGSPQEFEKWYADIGTKYQSNLHTIERIEVQIPAKGDYRVDIVVNWQALDRTGKFTSVRLHQQWKIVDGSGYWPRIVSYIVERAQ